MYRSKQFFRTGARGGNRTHVIGLEGRGNSHYTTRAFCVSADADYVFTKNRQIIFNNP